MDENRNIKRVLPSGVRRHIASYLPADKSEVNKAEMDLGMLKLFGVTHEARSQIPQKQEALKVAQDNYNRVVQSGLAHKWLWDDSKNYDIVTYDEPAPVASHKANPFK